jgi:hypothetical protein
VVLERESPSSLPHEAVTRPSLRQCSRLHTQPDVSVLLGHHGASLDNRYATFRDYAVALSSRVEMSTLDGDGTALSPLVGNQLRSNAAWHSKTETSTTPLSKPENSHTYSQFSWSQFVHYLLASSVFTVVKVPCSVYSSVPLISAYLYSSRWPQ